MRPFSSAETCMLLLFARLGEDKPLPLRDYRSLTGMLTALGASGESPDAELTETELIRLGLTRADASAMLRRLDRQEELARFLDYLDRHDMRVLTRISPEYPQRLRLTLGDRAPMLLFCAGEPALLHRACVSVVGSRQLREPGRQFAREAGRQAAIQDFTLVSGGATGADTVAFDAAMAAGGSAIVFLADSLEGRMSRFRPHLDAGRVLLVSLDGPDEHFSVSRAYARNALIHAMGQLVLVAQSDFRTGGTWQGAAENHRHGWSPVCMFTGEMEDPGTRGLLDLGCLPVALGDLADLSALNPAQTDLFC